MNRLSVLLLSLSLAAIALACGAGEQSCNGQCYLPSQNQCLTDFNGQLALCPVGTQVCNKACYNPANYHCNNGALAAGKASTSAHSTTSTTSTTHAATSSTTHADTPLNQGATSASTCVTGGGCPNNLCSCVGACYQSGQYNCPYDPVKKTNMLCQGNFAACDGTCYDATQKSCVNGKVVTGANAGGNAATSSTTSAAATKTSVTPVVVSPTPVANSFPTQTADLRIINSCKETLWFEGRYGGAGAPIPGQSVTSLRALPGSYIDYTVPDTGLSGSRFWAKYGCDANGKNCLIGDQMQYWPNPPGGCPSGGCTPPVDSLFEATWGCKPGASCHSSNPTTWFDTSQVDGWTLPYKLTPVGDTSGCDCVGSNCGFHGVDASHLDLARCPTSENLSNNGAFNSVTSSGKTVALNSVDLRIINNGKVLGCMSPCKRLNWGAPYGLQQPENSGATMWMCCPTPNPSNCSPSNGCVLPDTCRAGPIVNTQFVDAVHTMAPGVYAYSYDDGVGLHACPAGVVKYTMEFCPAGSAAYPGTA